MIQAHPIDQMQEMRVSLSIGEKEALDLLFQGQSSKEIAYKLAVSKRTIDYRLARIYEKLGVSNRVSAVRRGIELGLVTF